MSETPYRHLTLVLSFFALLLLAYRHVGSGRLEGQIVDDKTGQPVAATVMITDGEGKPLEIEGKHTHVEYLGKRRCYVDGAFSLKARPNRLVVEVRRGLETLSLKTDVDL